jgi:CBS domain-containing protein
MAEGRLWGLVFVKEIMRPDVKTARPDSAVSEVVEKMNRFDIGSIVIVQEKRPIGIITERDILRRVVEHCLDPRICKAKEIMTSPIVTLEEDSSASDAMKLMADRQIKRLPVVRNQELVGIITATDLIRNSPMLAKVPK